MVQQTTILGDEQKKDSFKGATYRVERGEERATIAQGDGWIETLTLTPHNPVDGFQVGAMANSWRTTYNPVNLRTLLIECANIFDNNDYVGYWLDDDGLYHIDPSDYYSEHDYYRALTMGIRNQQRSIWSFIQESEVPVATQAAFEHFNDPQTPSEGSEAPSEGSEMPTAVHVDYQRGYAVLRIAELEDLIQRNREASERSRELRKGSDLGTRAVDDVVVLDFEISDDEEVMSHGRHHLSLDLDASKF